MLIMDHCPLRTGCIESYFQSFESKILQYLSSKQDKNKLQCNFRATIIEQYVRKCQIAQEGMVKQ